MIRKLKLPNASSQYGAQMGRRNQMPTDKEAPIKLQMRVLRFVDGDYDTGGAYWGYTRGTAIYCAFGEDDEVQVRVFVRAESRSNAKGKIREDLPKAKFWR